MRLEAGSRNEEDSKEGRIGLRLEAGSRYEEDSKEVGMGLRFEAGRRHEVIEAKKKRTA